MLAVHVILSQFVDIIFMDMNMNVIIVDWHVGPELVHYIKFHSWSDQYKYRKLYI